MLLMSIKIKDCHGDKPFFMCFAEKRTSLQQQKCPVTKNLEWDFSLVIISCSEIRKKNCVWLCIYIYIYLYKYFIIVMPFSKK